MKIKVILMIIVPLLWAFSCDKTITLVASYADEFLFEIDEVGNFGVETETIFPADVTENVESDQIESVDIESIAIKYMKKDGNEVSSVTVDGTADDINVFTNYTLSLTEKENEWIAITDELNSTGVNHLKTKFIGFVNGTDNQEVILKVIDQSNNAGQRIYIDLYLQIKAGIVFQE